MANEPHPFIKNKQLCTIQLHERGLSNPRWTLMTSDSSGICASLYGTSYQIGDEVALITVKEHNGWSIVGIKKSEVDRFLNEYELVTGHSTPRYVPKKC